MKALAIDFGGTHATCGLGEDRTVLAYENLDTERAKSLRTVLPRIGESLRALIKNKSLTTDSMAGIAVGFAALVDSRGGRILSTNGKYSDAKDMDLVRWGH